MRLTQKNEGLINGIEYRHKRFKWLYAILIFILVCACLCAVIPIGWLFLVGFKGADEVFKAPFTFFPESIDLGKIVEVWKMVGFGKYFLNTIIVMLGSVFCAVVFNGLLAYSVSVVKPLGHKVVHGAIMASYMIPAVASLVPLYANITSLGFKGYALYIPLCLLYGANAYYYMMFKNYFDTIPRALFESARIDGASSLKMFFTIALPLSKPIVGVVSIFAMTASWADFLLPYLLLQDDQLATVMVKIYNLKMNMSNMMGFGIDKYLMALAISVLPQVLAFVIFQKQITGTNANSGIKG
ncbi:MAG: carbohydrate ABC transporter permease [Clostridia bacterium]|nr:carbohydrate ABC transporter permease [Clostridia bacterium]MBQ8505533.1 carbohydrate ABC transporter permease [Clostridia bacterium]MBQ8772706.1 carbohydrate ABC transporter permease [Clostridia bacterium]MBQ8872512.1 carbohydrate ABC transporter permease [Clostridia bacterium]